MSALREIVPSIFTWSEYSDEKQIHFNGYYIVHRQEAVIVDPAHLDEPGLRELQDLVSGNGQVALKGILLTNAHHDRMCWWLKDVFTVPVFINALDRDLLELPADLLFKDGDKLPCGLRAINFHNQKTPGETGFLLGDRKILIVGDALIGRVPGKLNLLPPDKYKDAALAKKSLGVLRKYEFDTLLVGDGTSILKDADLCVEDFLGNGG
ncbi:MAG: hypothetical protein HY579_00140 [Nitrospinae bacterium]|nr:hypothetical protein [Nitrospinota bacterium]